MPEWLMWMAYAAPVLAGGGWAGTLWLRPSGHAPTKIPKTETFAGTFQRCATETRGIAKMWEDFGEPGLAQLHANLAGIYQTYCEIYQQADTPVEAAAIVARSDPKQIRTKAKEWPSDELLEQVDQFRQGFLERQDARLYAAKLQGLAGKTADPGLRRGYAAKAKQILAAQERYERERGAYPDHGAWQRAAKELERAQRKLNPPPRAQTDGTSVEHPAPGVVRFLFDDFPPVPAAIHQPAAGAPVPNEPMVYLRGGPHDGEMLPAAAVCQMMALVDDCDVVGDQSRRIRHRYNQLNVGDMVLQYGGIEIRDYRDLR